MKLATNLQRFQKTTAHYFWIGAFFLLVAGVVTLLYFAALNTGHKWQWYRIPRYFVTLAEIKIEAEIKGEVEAIVLDGEKAAIRVKGDDATESYPVPTREDIRVSKGDMIYPGDVLATYPKWQPGLLLLGGWITLRVSMFAIIFGILIGLLGGIARVSSNPTLKWAAITYVELIRGSPLLVQIFIWYFVLGDMIDTFLKNLGLNKISPFGYGVAALAFFAGAYVTEIVRAGIQSVHHGQIEASRSLGMSYAQSMRHIILPQAIRRILPPLAGQFISLIKDSSLLGIIAVRELMKATREAVSTSLLAFELYFTCALLYLVITFTLSMFVQYLERRTAIK